MSDEKITSANSSDKKISCSFCGKSQEEVKKLIAGPNVYICNECVNVCTSVIAQEERKHIEPNATGSATLLAENLPTPKEIKAIKHHHNTKSTNNKPLTT